MELINKYKVVIAIVLPILILVLIKSFGGNHFKSDAKKWAEPSLTVSNIVSIEQLGKVYGEKLVLNIGEVNQGIDYLGIEMLNVPSDSILSKKIINTIRSHNGPVLLNSSGNAVSARIWMALSQMGCSNIFILTNDIDNEVLKYKFRTDTLVRPEF